MSKDLEQYIRDNRERYTRDAIRGRLVDEGYSDADIDAAWVAAGTIDRRLAPDPERPSAERTAIAAILIVIVLLAYGSAILLALVGISMVGSPYALEGGDVAVLVAYIATMAAGAAVVTWVAIRARSPSGSWRAIGGAVALSILVFAGLSGLCQVAISPA